MTELEDTKSDMRGSFFGPRDDGPYLDFLSAIIGQDPAVILLATHNVIRRALQLISEITNHADIESRWKTLAAAREYFEGAYLQETGVSDTLEEVVQEFVAMMNSYDKATATNYALRFMAKVAGFLENETMEWFCTSRVALHAFYTGLTPGVLELLRKVDSSNDEERETLSDIPDTVRLQGLFADCGMSLAHQN